MKTHALLVSIALLAFAACTQVPAYAQTAPAPDFPSQFIAAGVTFQSQSTPNFASGFVAYGKKLTDATSAATAYSYSKVSETNISLKPRPAIQTQTETGLCVYTATVFGFQDFMCATVGGATLGSTTGLSTSGTALFLKPLKNGYDVGFAVGPSYSGATGSVQWPVSAVLVWGK